MKQLLFLLLFPCLALAQYQGNANQKITLGEQTTADGLVWRGRLADTANLLTNKLDTSVYIVLDTGTRAMWFYRASTTPKWTRLVDSLNNLQGQLSLTTKVTGTLPVANGGTGATTLSPNNYLIRTNSSGIFDTSSVYEVGGNVGINTNNPLANLVLFNSTGTSTRFVAGNTNTPTALYSTYLNQAWSIFELYKDGLGSTGTTAFVGGINDTTPTSASATMTFIGYNKAVGTPGINDLRTHIIIGGLEAKNSGNFQFLTMNSGNISEKLRISASGNVGIGTSGPVVQFHTTGGVRFATFAGGGTTTLSVDNNGDLARTSSFELKKDVTPINYGLNEILQINPINFNWIDGDKFGNENENGFIAEDVMSIIPNVVGSDAHGLFMDYTKLIPILTKAIQEQNLLIKALEQRILNIENK